MIKIIPPEKCFWYPALMPDSELKNIPIKIEYAVFCECGVAYFEGREPYETVIVKCPNCGKEIIYG